MAKKKAMQKKGSKKQAPGTKRGPTIVKKKAAKKVATKKGTTRKKVVKKGTAAKKSVQKKAAVKKSAAKKPVKATRQATRKQPAGGTLALEEIKIVGGPLFLSTHAEVDQAEEEFGLRFPSGYREYVTQLGDGIFGGYYVRVYPPKRLLSGENNVREWRERINEYWFWDEGEQLLPKPQALESVIIGDTLDGDELVVHPSNPERIYVLPRYQEQAYHAGDGLLAALEWLSSAGILTEAYEQREFEPADSSQRREGVE